MNTLGKPKINRHLVFLIGGGILVLFLVAAVVYAATTPKSAPQPPLDMSAIYTSAYETALSHAPSTTVPRATTGPTSTAAPQALLSSKEDGHYLINVDIAPGLWQGNGTGTSCSWKITTATGDIVSKYSGPGWGIVYIPPTGFEVTFDQCGPWTFLRGP